MNERFIYEGDRLREISFPIGGIGSGCIGLAGNGRLVDWEIFNKPNKRSVNGFSHFAIKAESETEVLDARVLHGDYHPPFSGSQAGSAFRSFGFGVPREFMTGFPHFSSVRFTGTFPIAAIEFQDAAFPANVTLTGFNPLIPGNDRDSSIPAAFFEISIQNTSSQRLRYSIAGTLKNPADPGSNQNEYQPRAGSGDGSGTCHLLHLTGADADSSSPQFGDLCLGTDADEISYQEYWFRGSWFDNVSVYWQDFTALGPLKNRTYDSKGPSDGVAYGKEDQCVLAAHVDVDPGEVRSIRFVISWNYPNMTNYWNPERKPGDSCCEDDSCAPQTWKNYYATLFQDSRESAVFCLTEWDTLFGKTRAFRDALFSSTLPPEVIDAVSANISILKSPTVLRLEDGTFYGFEGCHPQSGCCEGSCTHVWNYAYALPFLFPNLERSMRDIDFAHNLDKNGGMAFRLQLPVGRDALHFRPCADGQFGGIIKMYREWKISGDSGWLKSHWENIKTNIEYAWSPENKDRWDRDRDGVLEGRQHHTLDMELFGPNSWLTGLYLAALLAAAEMGEYLGDVAAVKEYRELFEKGKAWVDEHLFNGEYYYHQINLSDKSIIDSYAETDESESYRGGRSITSAYWDEEHGQIKYQVAEGCSIDQVIAQWHANTVGLGEVLDRKKTRSALRSIYKYNFLKNMRNHINPCRIYALNDDAALLICSYPRSRPVITVPYAEEAMNGFEYQAACHMIQEGMLEEGLEVVRAIRDRYDGLHRNPWNEFECGSNYARSMASYALLPAMSGFEYDMVKGHIGFNPVERADIFTCFFSLDAGWGTVSIDAEGIKLEVLGGALHLRSFRCSSLADAKAKSINIGDLSYDFSQQGDVVSFDREVTVPEGSPLVINVE